MKNVLQIADSTASRFAECEPARVESATVAGSAAMLWITGYSAAKSKVCGMDNPVDRRALRDRRRAPLDGRATRAAGTPHRPHNEKHSYPVIFHSAKGIT